MKKFVLIFIILFCVLCVSIFKKPKDNSVVIKFSSWGSQSEVSLLLPLIKDFEKQNPDIKVEFLHIPQNYFQKLHLLFASNLAPDVVFINNYYAPKYIKAGLLEDLSSFVDKEKYFSKSIESFTYYNKIYAVPRDVSNLVVYYNKDLFDKYKIPYPNKNWTLNDYVNISKTFARHGIWGTSYETEPLFWLPYLLSNGAGILSDDAQEFVLNKTQALDSLDFYVDIAYKYNAAPKKQESASLTMAQLFLQQKMAMHLSGRWLVPKYRQEAKFDWDIVPFPNGTKGSVVNIDSSGYALAKSSRHKNEALKFINYISSKESLSELAKSGLIVPARKDVAYSDEFLDKNQKPASAQVFVDVIESGKVTPVNENYQKITDKLNTALEPLFLGQKKARQVVTDRLVNELNRF